MSSTIDQLDLFEFEDDDAGEPRLPSVKKKREHKPADYRYIRYGVPGKNGMPYCIVPEVAPILQELAHRCWLETGQDKELPDRALSGVTILGCRAALILGVKESAAIRRLHAVVHRRQLFINAAFIEACLMAMDAEHDYTYSEWPQCRADALEKVSLDAESAGKNLSPDKLLKKANRLYEKGYRKALKRFPEVRP